MSVAVTRETAWTSEPTRSESISAISASETGE